MVTTRGIHRDIIFDNEWQVIRDLVAKKASAEN